MLDEPYLGPSRVRLVSVYDLLKVRDYIESGAWTAEGLVEVDHWTHPPQPRDRTNDVTDEQISELL